MSSGSARRCRAGGRWFALAAVGSMLLAACTTSGHPDNTSPSPTPVISSDVAPSPSLSTPAPTDTAAPTTKSRSRSSSAAPSSEPATTSASPSPTHTVPPLRTTCTSIEVRVIRGSASLGQEIAALQFVNTGKKPCLLVGYPTATLLLRGKPIGKPSQPASTATSKRMLQPGDVAESVLHDYTNCNAPLSDNVRVRVPGLTVTAVRPAQLRACVLRVAKLGAPD